MKIYYAHCIAIYDTNQEVRDINLLESLGFDVVNPNEEWHRKACTVGDYPMGYFIDLALSCDALAFRAIPGLGIPAGVVKEIKAAEGMMMPVIELPNSFGTRCMSVEDTRCYLKECGKR
jgi:hypothetical protein